MRASPADDELASSVNLVTRGTEAVDSPDAPPIDGRPQPKHPSFPVSRVSEVPRRPEVAIITHQRARRGMRLGRRPLGGGCRRGIWAVNITIVTNGGHSPRDQGSIQTLYAPPFVLEPRPERLRRSRGDGPASTQRALMIDRVCLNCHL